MGRELNCLRCGNSMKYIKSQKIQLGQQGLIWGDIPNVYKYVVSLKEGIKCLVIYI